MDWWGYYNIWKINYSIENIEPLGEDVLTKTERENRLGELYFLRAYCYFAMAKRYGGVPIILEAQDPDNTPEDEYFPSRDSEEAVYNQVIKDVQLAFDILPDRFNSSTISIADEVSIWILFFRASSSTNLK